MIEKLFRIQIKIINFLNRILIAYLNTCTLVLIDTKNNAFFLIRKNSRSKQFTIGSLRMKKSPKIIILSYSIFEKKTQFN